MMNPRGPDRIPGLLLHVRVPPRLSNASIRILAQSFVARGTASFPPPTRVDAERGHGLHPSSLPGRHQQTGRKWHDAQAHCRGIPRHGANKNNRPGKSRVDPARHCNGWLAVCDASLWLMYYPVLYLHITSPSHKHGALSCIPCCQLSTTTTRGLTACSLTLPVWITGYIVCHSGRAMARRDGGSARDWAANPLLRRAFY